MKNFDRNVFGFIHEQSLVKAKDRILVACSGGVDSVALLHFFAVNREKLDVEVAAVHVDHMLRGEESAADGVLVSELCEKLKVPFFGGRIPVPEIIEKEGGNVQAICREERYAYFTGVMQEQRYTILATAHHGEDQLETVLMQVTKGITPSGIPNKRKIDGGMLIRPFLPTTKESLYSYAEENKLLFNEDPSNESDTYMRNRFRRHVVPHILNENRRAPESVVSMASQLQEDEAFLHKLAKQRVKELIDFTDAGLPTFSSRTFSGMPTALQRRMITLVLGYLYDETQVAVHYKSSLVEQLLHHLNSEDGNVSINLPLGYRFLREYDKLSFVRESDESNLDSDKLKIVPKGKRTDWLNGLWIYWADVDDVTDDLLMDAKEIMYFDLSNESLPLFLRRREEGDRILLPGMTNSKRLSRLFIDEKVSKTMRDSLPVIVTKRNEVCAVPGLRYDTTFTTSKTLASRYIFILGESSN